MNSMFSGATAFNEDIGSWDINNLTPSTGGVDFCINSGLSTTNYDLLLVAWNSNTPVVLNLIIDFGSTQYSSGSAAARANLTKTIGLGGYGWTINDGGPI